MVKFVFRLLGIILLSCIIFVAVSLWKGGNWIRSAGEFVYKISQTAGHEADKIYNCRKETEKFCDSLHKKIKGMFNSDGDRKEKTDRDK